MLDGLGVVAHILQSAGDLEIADILVHDDGEAQGNGAGTGGDHHLVEGAEGVDEGGNAVLGVLEESTQIAGLDVAEDQGCTDGHGDHVNDAGDVVAQRHHAELKAHLHTLSGGLLDAVADHEGHNALGLVVLHHVGYVGSIVRLAQHHSYAGDVTGNQRHAQGADDGIGHKADAGILSVGVTAAYILEALDNLSAHSGGKTGIQGLSNIVLIGDEALEDAHTGGQIPQGLNLYASGGVDGGEEISGVGEGHGGVGAMLGNGVVDSALGEPRHGVGTGIDQISQCTHRLQPPQNSYPFGIDARWYQYIKNPAFCIGLFRRRGKIFSIPPGGIVRRSIPLGFASG